MRLFCLSPADVELAWGDFTHLFDKFHKLGLIPDVIKKAAQDSKQQVWGIQDETGVHGLWVTEIIQTSQGLVCLIVAACAQGIRKPLMERMVDEIGAWSKGLGCIAVRYYGRKGWLRWDRRFRQTGVVGEWSL